MPKASRTTDHTTSGATVAPAMTPSNQPDAPAVTTMTECSGDDMRVDMIDNAVYNASRNCAKRDGALLKIVRDAHANPERWHVARQSALAGYLVGRLGITKLAAVGYLRRKEKDAPERPADVVTALASGRKVWQRILHDAGLVTLTAQGGKEAQGPRNNPATDTDATDKAADAKATAAEAAKTVAVVAKSLPNASKLGSYLMSQAATMFAVINKSKGARPAFITACEVFAAAIAAEAAKIAAENS